MAPWRLDPQGAGWHNHLQEPVAASTAEVTAPTGCRITVDGATARLVWTTTEDGVTVTVDASLAGDDLDDPPEDREAGVAV